MKIWDTFLFSGLGPELDLLECRLTELGNCGDIWRHVIAEGTLTHQGRPKPLVFPEHKDRFAPWRDKIAYVAGRPDDGYPGGTYPGPHWAREGSQREMCGLGLADAVPGDLILHGDLDEIPSPAAVAALHAAAMPGPVRLRQHWALFAVDWQAPVRQLTLAAVRKAALASFTDLRRVAWPPVVPDDPGWHLSWLGGTAAMRAKVRACAHHEDVPVVHRDAGLVQRWGFAWWDFPVTGTSKLVPVDVGDSHPAWVRASWDPVRKCRFPDGPAPESWFRPRLIMKKVSILTPTWQRGDMLLQRCIPSVEAQTYARVEHLIVSDGPDAGLKEQLTQPDYVLKGLVYAELDVHDPAPHWGHHARAYGLEIASGEYIAYVDDDDKLLPRHCEVLAAALDEHPEAGFALSRMISHGPGGDCVIGHGEPSCGNVGTPQIVHRREIAEVATWDHPGQAEDWDLVWRWINAGVQYVQVDAETCECWPSLWR